MNQIYYGGTTDIGASRELPLFGFGERNKSACGSPGRLEANWIFVSGPETRDILIVSVDTLFSSVRFEQAISNSFCAGGYTAPALFIVASHTHYAPALDPTKPRLGKASESHIVETAQLIVGEVLACLEKRLTLSPVLWSFGEKEYAGSVYRRARRIALSRTKPHVRIAMQMAPNPVVQIDHAVRLWVGFNNHNQPQLALATWPCHATSRADDGAISPDFIGVIRSSIRRALGSDLPVIFFPGASGDIRADHSGFGRWRQLVYPYPLQRCFIRPSERLCAAFDSRLAAATAMCVQDLRCQLEFGASAIVSTNLPLQQIMKTEKGGSLKITKLTLGGLDIIGLGAEVNSRWPTLLDLIDTRHRTIISGCVGPCFGYLPTDRQVPLGGYEVHGFRDAFNFSGRYSEAIKIEPAITAAIARLISDKH